MEDRIVTVVGGTGFLGRRVVQALAEAGNRVRVGARRPAAVDFGNRRDRLVPMVVDVRDEQSVREAVAGAAAVVNAVSLYVEKDGLTFDAIHVEGAERLARCARVAGVEQLVHISGIGADADSRSGFVRARARGERAVREVFEAATLVRPSVMVACDDAFLTSLETVTRLPVVPLFGHGENRLQPAYVNDVASALARLVERADLRGRLFELGGGRIYTYREAVQTVMSHLGRNRVLLPVPFAFWHGLVRVLGFLPSPPITRDQLILLEADNIVGSDANTFSDLGMEPRTLESIVQDCFPRSV
jgi:NADH dehydrogenase